MANEWQLFLEPRTCARLALITRNLERPKAIHPERWNAIRGEVGWNAYLTESEHDAIWSAIFPEIRASQVVDIWGEGL